LNVPRDEALSTSIVFGLMNLLASLTGGVSWLVEQARPRKPVSKDQAAAKKSFVEVPTEGL
jgi:hypothetical protein